MRSICLVGILCVLSACGEVPAQQAASGTDHCNARAQRGLVGQVPADLAAITTLAPKVRLIHPGDVVTQDDQPDRLNVVFDERGRVTRVFCG